MITLLLKSCLLLIPRPGQRTPDAEQETLGTEPKDLEAEQENQETQQESLEAHPGWTGFGSQQVEKFKGP